MNVMVNVAMQESSTPKITINRRWLISIIIIGVLLRVLFIFVLDPHPNIQGSDVRWYLYSGLQLVTNTAPPLQPGPLYLVYVGELQLHLPDFTKITAMRGLFGPFWLIAPLILDSGVLQAIRVLNIGWHVLLMIAIYWLGTRYFDERVGRFAALIVAIGPVFIIESSLMLTESMFLGIFFGTLALYSIFQDRPNARNLALIGVLLGLSTLTRAVVLLFPVVIIAQLIRFYGWRRGLKLATSLVITYVIMVSTWTAYNAWRWQRFVIGADNLFAFAWQGMTGQLGAAQTDAAVNQTANQPDHRDQAFIAQILDKLEHDLPSYLKGRITNIGGAYLQPHNTEYFSGASLKDVGLAWWRTDRSISGLLAITQSDAFWPKLALYIFHYWALIFGLIGMLLNWRRVWILAPLLGYFLYTSAVHTILLALPRYVFPVEPILILFGVAAMLVIWRRGMQAINSRAKRTDS